VVAWRLRSLSWTQRDVLERIGIIYTSKLYRRRQVLGEVDGLLMVVPESVE